MQLVSLRLGLRLRLLLSGVFSLPIECTRTSHSAVSVCVACGAGRVPVKEVRGICADTFKRGTESCSGVSSLEAAMRNKNNRLMKRSRAKPAAPRGRDSRISFLRFLRLNLILLLQRHRREGRGGMTFSFKPWPRACASTIDPHSQLKTAARCCCTNTRPRESRTPER